MMAKLMRPSTTTPERKNIVQLSEEHYLSESNWLSGLINETRQEQPVKEPAIRDAVNPSVGRQHLPGRLTRMSVKSMIDSDHPSVLDFVRNTNDLPKMFYLEKEIQQEEDSYPKAVEYSKLPCQQDSFDCHDTFYEKPPEQFYRVRHRPTQRPAIVPLLQNHRPSAHPLPLVIRESLHGTGLLKYFKLTPDD